MGQPTTRSRGLATTIRAYVDLPHPWAVLVVMLATALFGLLATGGHPNPLRYALLLASMFGGQVAIGALNEYRDRDLDARARRRKPIPDGLISPRVALGITLGGLAVMVLAGAALGPASLALACLGTGAGLAYDLGLKRTAWSWLPYLVALPLLPAWVWVSLDRLDARLLLLYPLGALMALAVHLAQSLPDAESDRAAGMGGLAARLGRGRAFLLAWGAAAAAAGEVALAGWLLSPRPLPALAASLVVLAGLIAVIPLRRGAPAALDRHLFKLMTVSAVILGAGWVLSIAG